MAWALGWWRLGVRERWGGALHRSGDSRTFALDLGVRAGMPGWGTALTLPRVSGYMRAGAGRTGILTAGKPCGATRVNLVRGLADGTFYIRARLRAGACVPVVSETLGHEDPSRVAERLAVWTLSLRSPDSVEYGLLTSEKASLSAEGRARHARPRGSEESRNSQVNRVETAGNRRFSDSRRLLYSGAPTAGPRA
jgi:hypothetical protein